MFLGHFAVAFAASGAMFAGAVVDYARGRATGKGFWALIALLAGIYVANVAGPPPPSVTAIAVSCLVLIPVLWFGGNRADRRAPAAS